MITTKVENCARCGRTHEAIVFTRFDRPPPDSTHYGTCPDTKQPILMVVRDADAPRFGSDTLVPGHHLAQALNMGLALYRAHKTGHGVDAVKWGEGLLRLAQRWNNPSESAGGGVGGQNP